MISINYISFIVVSGVLSFMIATNEIITKWSCGGDYTLKYAPRDVIHDIAS